MQASTQHSVIADALIPTIKSDSRAYHLATDATLVIGFALIVSIMAQIAIRIPTTTVPITGQTFGVLLAGAALGSKRGGLSMFVYMLLGMIGLPIFAPASPLVDGQNLHFILPWAGSNGLIWSMTSGGYILGFVLSAYLVGLLAERNWDRASSAPLAMLLGNLGIYLVGLPWLALHIMNNHAVYDFIAGSDVLDKTLKGGLYPFIGGDAVKLLAASIVLPGTWSIIDRIKGQVP